MPLTKNFTTTPFHGRSAGGTNLRNIRRHGAILRGTKSVVWQFLMPIHGLELGSTADTRNVAEGGIIFDDGVAGEETWVTVFPGVACSLTIDTHTTSINSEITVLLSGYDQFDRLVEEEITIAAGDRTGLSRAAYSEVIRLELKTKSTAEPADLDVAVLGVSDHDGFSAGLTGVLIPSTRIGLPCMPDRFHLIQAVLTGQSTINGYVRQLSDDVWSVQSESGSVTDSVVLTNDDVQDLGAGTMLLPGFTLATGVGMGCVMFDPSIADATI